MKEMKRSEIFWSILFILAQVALGFYMWEALVIIHFFLSLYLIAIAMVNEYDSLPKVFYITPLMGILVIFILIGTMVYFIYKNTIQRFNDFLNKPSNNK